MGHLGYAPGQGDPVATAFGERDQVALVARSAALLAPGGRLYFSNNRQGFRLDAALEREWRCEEITARTVPEEFKRRQPHRCWLIMRP